MKKTTYILFVLFCYLILSTTRINAQLISGNAFLQGNWLEVGISNNGAFGTTEDAPTGYHPNNTPIFAMIYNPVTATYSMRPQALGFVADYDSNGWANGTPPYFGDYFLPGTPQEGWSIEIDGIRSDAYSANFQTIGTTGFVGGSLNGANQNVTASSSEITSKWTGSAGNLIITQTTTVKFNKLYCTGHVTLRNSGTTTLNNIYYMRTVDPDNDVSNSGIFTTINTIDFQNPNADQKALIGSLSTTDTNAYLGLCTKDCRAKAFICNFGLFPPADSLSGIYSGTHPDLTYTGQTTSDVGIGLVYNIGEILPGDSTELYFAYILNKTFIDEAVGDINAIWGVNGTTYHDGDTVQYCQNSIVPITIGGGTNTNWSWTSTDPLSNTTGTSNNLTLGTSIANVAAIGSGGCTDTIHLVIVPTNMIYQTLNVTSCNGTPYNFYGTTYSTSGTYTALITTPSSCDTFVTLNLTISSASTTSSSITASSCSNYILNGQIYTSSGTYTQLFTNSSGCDSIVTLYLTINQNSLTNLPAIACDSYSYLGNTYTTSGNYQFTYMNSVGCDSIFTLQLTINHPTASYLIDTACVEYHFGPQTCTATGFYYQTLTNSVGCDSSITLNLTVLGTSAIIDVSGISLTTPSAATTYQWLTCNPYSVISGATGTSYTPTFGSDFALVVSLDGCIDTSNCINFYPEGIQYQPYTTDIQCIPNPVNDILTIQSYIKFDETKIRLLDLTGNILRNDIIHQGNEFKIDMSDLASGIYILELNWGEQSERIKIYKE